MTVITSFGATPNRIAIVCRYLLAARGEQGIARAELRGLLAPRSLRGGDGRQSPAVEDVLSEMRLLGLIEDSDGALSVASEVRGAGAANLVAVLERLLLLPELAERAGQGRFPYAVAWLLAQDPARPLPFREGVALRVSHDCGDDVNAYDLTNPDRFRQFYYWASYLGFAWRYAVEIDRDLVVPDPTVALRRLLPDILAGPGSLPVRELIAAWAERCPVLEGGSVRAEVEARFPVERRRRESDFSVSTTLALSRLEAEGLIALERPSDATAMIAGRPVSHVALRR